MLNLCRKLFQFQRLKVILGDLQTSYIHAPDSPIAWEKVRRGPEGVAVPFPTPCVHPALTPRSILPFSFVFFMRGHLLQFTRVNMTEADYASWRASQTFEPLGELQLARSRQFFLSMWTLHIGVVACITDFSQSWMGHRSMWVLEEGVSAAAGPFLVVVAPWPSLPLTLSFFFYPPPPPTSVRHFMSQLEDAKRQNNAPMVARLKPIVSEVTRMQLAFEADLTDPELLSQLVTFYNLTASWMLHLLGVDVDTASSVTELPAEPTEAFNRLPDFILQDMLDTYAFVAKTQPQLLAESPVPEQLVVFLITLLAGTNFINVHQRARIVEVLAETTPEMLGDRSSRFFELSQSYPVAVENLGPALMRFYVGAPGALSGLRAAHVPSLAPSHALLFIRHFPPRADAEDIDPYSRPQHRRNMQIILKNLWRVRPEEMVQRFFFFCEWRRISSGRRIDSCVHGVHVLRLTACPLPAHFRIAESQEPHGHYSEHQRAPLFALRHAAHQ